MSNEEMIKRNEKMIKIAVAILIIQIIGIAFLLGQIKEAEQKLEEHRIQFEKHKQELEDYKKELEDLKTLERDNSKVEVIFTNYYTNDNTGSTNITYSGLTTDKFDVNEDGFYTYENKVVLATANEDLSYRFTLKNGYKYNKIGDVIEFELNDKEYVGIVLDACGACFGVSHEKYQRYDIFTTGANFGHKGGFIYE